MEMHKNPNEHGKTEAAFALHHILVPTDFSACAKEALAFAVALGAEHGAKIRLLHVLRFYELELDGTVPDAPHAAPLREYLEANAWERLADAVRLHAGRSVEIEPVVQHSLAPAEAIGEEARRCGADLIVIGTHGRRGANRVLMGSVAEEVVRRAPVPVLTVRGQAPAGMSGIRRILAPTDLSERSGEAVEVAKSLAVRYGAALDLLYVIEPIPFPASMATGTQNFYDYLPQLRAELVKALERLAGPSTEASADVPSVDVHIEEGHAAHTIARFAEAHRSDLIVMATQGRTGLPRFFLGSVAEYVVRAASCPVLTVRTEVAPSEKQALSAKPHQEVTS